MNWCAICLLGLAGGASLLGLSPRPLHQPALSRISASARATPYSIPLAFEPNLGQAEPRVEFIGRGNGITVLLTREGIEFVVRSGAPGGAANTTLKMRFERDERHAGRRNRAVHQWRGEARLRSETNYFIGNDPRRWRTHVPHFAQASAANAIPGVDAVVYGTGEGLEYDFRLAPGTDAGRLRINISGAEEFELDSRGDLVMRAGGREIRMRKPDVYEEFSSGARREVEGGYVPVADGRIGFRVGPHRADATLVLDPTLTVSYSTFLGGAGVDSANSMAVDSLGKVYIAGTTTSATTFAESGGKAIGPGGGGTDYFIAKIDPAASGANSLVYLTFLGGSGSETGGLIAVDASGNVAITGTTTSADFPVTDASKRTTGSNDVTVSEIDPTGGKFVFSTLFGGNGAEATQNPGGIALDKSGNIFIATDTTSTDLPATPGAFQAANGGGVSDGFVAEFTPGTTPQLRYCTYLGINAQVGVTGVAIDAGGNAYLAGFTSNPGTSFAAMNAFQSTYGGDPFDAFLMKIRPSGNGAADLAYATFLGGANSDQAFAVRVGTAMPATAYVTGTTQSVNFPTGGTAAAFQPKLQTTAPGGANAFFSLVAQDATTGMTSLGYSTYLGGSQSDAGLSVAFAAVNAVYVAGETTSANYPWLDNFQPFNGDQAAFLTKLDPTSGGTASLVYSTPLGGTAPAGISAVTAGNAVALDAAGHVYIAGQTTAADFPRTATPMNGVQLTCASCQSSPPAADSFLVGISENSTGSAPSVSFNATKLNFGGQVVGAQNVPPQSGAVINTGSASLTISDIELTGSADFSFVGQSNCKSGPIAPGGKCTFEVGFTPTIVGEEGAILIVTDNAPGNPQVLSIVGVGDGPLAVPSPAALNFGSEPQGAKTAPMTMKLNNTGNQPLHISNVLLGGADAAQFQNQGSTCQGGAVVPAGGNCFYAVAFSPIATGTFNAEIDVFDDAGNLSGAEQVIPLTGTGTPPAPIATISPASLGFGSEASGTTSGTQTVTLTNNGGASLNVSSIAITGSDAPNFGIVTSGNNPCQLSNLSLAKGASCTVAVDFAPESDGAKSASLSFTDDAGGSPQRIALTGTGATPAIQFLPASLPAFGSQSVGTTSATQTVLLTNTGNAPLGFQGQGITITGTSAKDFKQTNNCVPALGNTPPNNTCMIQVSFAPVEPGNLSAAVSFVDNAPQSPQMIALAGIAVQPAVTLSPTSINFGSEITGTPSAAQPVTVKNSGSGVLIVTGASVTDTADFSVQNNCTGNTAPGSTCTIQVTFNPASAGSKSTTLILTDNAPDSPQSIPLSGSGTGYTLEPPPMAQTTQTVKAGATAMYQLSVTSAGSGKLSTSCTSAPTGANCSILPPMIDVTANTPAMFQVNATALSGSAGALREPMPNPGSNGNWQLIEIAFAAMAMVWIVASRRRKLTIRRLVQVGALASVAVFASCGGGGGGGAAVSVSTTYTLTVTVSTGVAGQSQSVPLTLIVQ
ncbi:MAG: choice-of-anchor D domain-containing protein [Candidatus Acidiferrales bacterium]